MQKTYRESTQLQIRNCDLTGHWRPGDMMEFLQEAAGTHSSLLGASRTALRQQGIAWVLTRIEVEMDRWPGAGDTVSVETWPMPTRRCFFPRCYLLRDGENREIGRAGSLWVLLDLNTRHMTTPENIVRLIPDNSDLPAPIGLPAPVRQIAGTLETVEKRPEYTDFDTNLHVNNCRYVDWCCNMLGVETLAQSELARFALNFDQEIRPGMALSCELRRLGDAYSYLCRSGSTVCFEMGGTLRPRTDLPR